jgi:hypothetical protein
MPSEGLSGQALVMFTEGLCEQPLLLPAETKKLRLANVRRTLPRAPAELIYRIHTYAR